MVVSALRAGESKMRAAPHKHDLAGAEGKLKDGLLREYGAAQREGAGANAAKSRAVQQNGAFARLKVTGQEPKQR
jgi:hypothetical protein